MPKPRLDLSDIALDSSLSDARTRASRAITEGERAAKILSVPVFGRSRFSRGYLDEAILSGVRAGSIDFNVIPSASHGYNENLNFFNNFDLRLLV